MLDSEPWSERAPFKYTKGTSISISISIFFYRGQVHCFPSQYHTGVTHVLFMYFYRLLSGSEEPLPVFEKDRAWHVFEQLDLIAIKKACSILVGHHDFSSFRAAGCQATSPVKTLDELGICEVASFLCFPSRTERREMSFKSSTDDTCFSNVAPETCTTESNGSFGERSRHRCFVITARARSFLYHQVRLLVGVLKRVGTVKKILNAKTVQSAIPMAPACGLYLGNVKYHFS
ncbi:uncharacterized protein LOC110094718 isoform X2 [Dendrobium catenatum]|uniref:uncharacterized protein LOC110094718 isoform X2 n=1 Tax=Dendrobium catenatum TaxID=906689 RepID=UPI0010A03B24|nr:uncharacterized protein LOC110094718 isoform X2 [Dendrobium catenatum]